MRQDYQEPNKTTKRLGLEPSKQTYVFDQSDRPHLASCLGKTSVVAQPVIGFDPHSGRYLQVEN